MNEDLAMQIVVELACVDPIALNCQSAGCVFCGTQLAWNLDESEPLVSHIPFCVWWQAWQLAQPWLTDRQKKTRYIHRQDGAQALS